MAKMTKQQKEAMAEGRRQTQSVNRYLEALNTEARGSRDDEPTLRKKISDLEARITGEANPAKRVELIQKRLDREERLRRLEDAPDVERLEKDFKKVVKPYSERKGISYKAWREEGVPAAVLRDAGLSRGFKP